MIEYKEGDTVEIRCKAKKAPFPHEHLIKFVTMDGEMEGFVQESQLKEGADGWQVRGVVNRVETDFLVVRVWGEFLRTAGLVKLPFDSVVGAE